MNIIDKNTPFKKASRREQKLASKPWLTKRTTEVNYVQKYTLKSIQKSQNEECYKQYKTYRNQSNRLIK